MASSKAGPKVLLFDIGGVCVVSPMQAILDYELENNIPPGWVNNCISKSKPNGYWHRLERGELSLNKEWFEGFTDDLHLVSHWDSFYQTARTRYPMLPAKTPLLPEIDGEALFWSMMRASRDPDPWMYPALQNLKKSGKYILAALSNTIVFPEGHPYADASPVKEIFDVFVSSAHVGLRKPDPRVYEYTLREVDRFARGNPERGFEGGVKAGDVVFLDDIGENLKAGKAAGFGTIKVPLGRAYEAVDQLEALTGLKLAGSHPRVPVEPGIGKGKSRKGRL